MKSIRGQPQRVGELSDRESAARAGYNAMVYWASVVLVTCEVKV